MSREKQIEEMTRDICDIECKGMKCNICDSYGCEYRMQAEALYNAGYRKRSEWISVDDGEPEEATNVLCIENDSYYLAFLEDGVWFDCVAYYRDDTFTQVFPTHWMPLPEAPKMKGGE